MATLTIRNVSDELVERLKSVAARHGHSMEQEVRLLLEGRYRDREEVLRRIEAQRAGLPKASADEIDRWISDGRT